MYYMNQNMVLLDNGIMSFFLNFILLSFLLWENGRYFCSEEK